MTESPEVQKLLQKVPEGGDLNRKEVQRGGDSFTCTAESFCRTAETNTGFPRSSVDKESACSAGDLRSIPGLGRSPGEEIG